MPVPQLTPPRSATRSNTLDKRIATFVAWIATEGDREDDIRNRASNVRTAIREQADADGLIVRSTPWAGSFATRTGLRRHMRGDSEVEGQDVDLPFVVSPETDEQQRLTALLPRFERYARNAYPDTARETTKSSVRLLFADKVNFDLVPLLATADPERQILVRADGERRETSVQRHVDFVKSRTDASNRVAGPVRFNELVRLMKWWRCTQQASGGVLTDVPSFLINLLAAHAFDHRGVRATYAATIADWFGFLSRQVRSRTLICFDDYKVAAKVDDNATWTVLDPVNNVNNITAKWRGVMCDELVEWLEAGRDAMHDAITAFGDGRDIEGVEFLVNVFGNSFRNHSEAA